MTTYVDTFPYADQAQHTAQADRRAHIEESRPKPRLRVDHNNMVVHYEVPSILGCGGSTLRIMVTRLVPEDMSVKTCINLAIKTCSLSCAITEVVRGRFEIQTLERHVDEQNIRQVKAMADLLQGEYVRGSNNLPTVPMFAHATVVNSECFDATVGIGIGNELHLISLVLRLHGSRWVATQVSVS